MVDLATLRGLHPSLANTPCLLYMHENQFAFPVSDQQRGRVEPQMVNLYSALAADAVAFNSAWNRDSFLQGVEGFLNKMPDAVPDGVMEKLRERSSVLPVPIEDRLFIDQPRPVNQACPHLLWNHRWEYDKGPDRLLLLEQLKERAMPFRISVVGEGFRSRRKHLTGFTGTSGHIEHWGFLERRADYDRLLGRADIVLTTALHDFRGWRCWSWLWCLPLAPDRLAYREYVPPQCRYTSIESTAAEARAAADRLAGCLNNRLLQSRRIHGGLGLRPGIRLSSSS